MKKMMILVVAAVAFGTVTTAAAQTGGDMKRWEITFGYASPTGDQDSILGNDSGWIFGLDYYTNTFGTNTMGFFGARGFWLGDAVDWGAYGAHYGLRGGFSQGGAGQGAFYWKLAAGYYFSGFRSGSTWSAEAGFGGWVGLGWDFNSAGGNSSPFCLEAGYYTFPTFSGVNNNGWFISAGLRF